jgi:hypothetical protein
MSNELYKLCFMVPPDHAEAVKSAVFEAGAGRLGNYDRCCWQTVGTGQFRPLEGSRPFAGETGHVSVAEEVKVELVCAEEFLQEAIRALKQTHPYETPAYEAWPIRV